MMNKVVAALIIPAILLSSIAINGQQASKDTTIFKLKEDIQRLELIDRDLDTPAEVKQINSKFLRERRIQLQTLLQKRINSLQTYLTTIGSTLTSEESQVVANSIQKLKVELETLISETQDGSSLAASVSNPPLVASVLPVAYLSKDSIANGQLTPSNSINSNHLSTLPVVNTSNSTSTHIATAKEDKTIITTSRDCATLTALRAKDPNAISELENFICAEISRIQTRKATDLKAGIDLADDFFRMV
ncbi:MAG TPA: hypothetical protein VFQ47_03915, partial [Nitrososphaera sp.]|nr:hypothetical protein [Nitrososphaera sp.]